MPIYVLIPVFNRIAYTKKIIHCLRQQTLKKKLIITIIDDGSSDGTDIWLNSQNDINIIKGSGKLFWAGAIDLAIKEICKNFKNEGWILLINNDVEIKNDYVENLIKIANENYPSAVGSIVKNKKEEIISIGAKIYPKTFEVKDLLNCDLFLKDFNLIKDADVLSGRGVLYPFESFIETKGMRPKFFPHYFADYELSIRVKKKGYKLILSKDVFVYSEEDFNLKSIQRRKENLIFKHFSKKSSSLFYAKLFFWWEASNIKEKISLPFRIIKFMIVLGLRKFK